MTRQIIYLFPVLLLSSFAAGGQGFFDWNVIHEIRITFKESDWDRVLDSIKQLKTDERLLAVVEIDGKKFPDVGVRYKGNSSYFNVRKYEDTKLPFNLKSNHVHPDQFFPGKTETLKLSNVFRDPSFLREVISYEIAREYMPAPRANFARVFVNEVYMGLYNSTESVEDDFLEDYFGEKKGILVKCDPEEWGVDAKPGCPPGDKASLMYLGEDPDCYKGFYEMKSDSGWDQLILLTKILNNQPERIEEILDVDMALWMLAYNMVLLNFDSYTGRLSHNYYLYQRKNGQFVPLIWDLNLSLGGFRFVDTGKALNKEELQTVSPFIYYKDKDPTRPLITQLLSNPLYRKIYVGHIRTLVEENFSNGAYLKRCREIQEFIDQEVRNDKNKLYSYEAFQANLDSTSLAGKTEIYGIAELMEGRAKYLLSHPVLSVPPPPISEVQHFHYGPTLAVNARIGGAQKAWLVYRYDKDDRFVFLEMFDDGGHNDQVGGDDIWGATIDWKQGTHYYIVAEGERSASLSPSRASFEYYKVKKED
ncbi:MAG: CotH kinase family protein [Saprospirales bacterium]|nr:CotH kinase family protein [Saprospirales bacterium]